MQIMKHFNSGNTSAFLGMLVAMAVMASCKGEPQKQQAEQPAAAAPATEQGIAFREEGTGKTFEAYLSLKDAFIASDAEAVARAADAMNRQLGPDQTGLGEVLTTIGQAGGIEAQRALLPELTAKLEPVLRDEMQSGTIYKQFCPMAFDNKGASWLSDSQEIRNPYFGDMMLTCGKVEDMLVAR